MHIQRTHATREHFFFLRQAYPWDWGSEEKFAWKHQKDPYCGEDVYEYRGENGELIAIIFARAYPFVFQGKTHTYLSFMEYAVKEEYRNSGIVTKMQARGFEDFQVSAAIGTASRSLYEKIYKSNPVFTVLRSMEVAASRDKEVFHVLEDTELVARKLNENPHPFYVRRTPEYVAWIRQNPDCDRVVFVQSGDDVFGIGIAQEAAHVLEMSSLTEAAYCRAHRIASQFGDRVLLDVPAGLALSSIVPKREKDIYIVFQPLDETGRELLRTEGTKWIPKVDRR